ncbi:MAG: hypothetical protein K2Y07_06230 [Nitrosomonas sp.]|nr:hypothetical protein [Nitrosomonas sp.]
MSKDSVDKSGSPLEMRHPAEVVQQSAGTALSRLIAQFFTIPGKGLHE